MVFKNKINKSVLVPDRAMHMKNDMISALMGHVFCKDTPKIPELNFDENKMIPNKYILRLSSKDVNRDSYFMPNYELGKPNGMYIASTKKAHTLVYTNTNSTQSNINNQYIMPFIDVLTRNNKQSTIVSVNSSSIFADLKPTDHYFKLLKKRGYGLNTLVSNSKNSLHSQKFIDFTRQAYIYYKQNNYVKFKALMSEIETLLFSDIDSQDPMWMVASKNVFELGTLMYFDHVLNITQVSLQQIVNYVKTLLTTKIDTKHTYSFIQDIINDLDPNNMDDLTIFDAVMLLRERQNKRFYEFNIASIKCIAKSIKMLHAIYGVTLVPMLTNVYYLSKYLGTPELESMFYDLDNPQPQILDLTSGMLYSQYNAIVVRYLDYVLNVINQNQIENSTQHLYLILDNRSNYKMPDFYKTITSGLKFNEQVTLILTKDDSYQLNKVYKDIHHPDQFLKQNFEQMLTEDEHGMFCYENNKNIDMHITFMPLWMPDSSKLTKSNNPIDFKEYYQNTNPDSPNLHKGMSNLFNQTVSSLLNLADDQTKH